MPESCPKRFARVSALVLALVTTAAATAAAETPYTPLDPSGVNGFDRAFMFRYSATQDHVADAGEVASFLVPATLAFAAPTSDWGEIALMYAGSTALALGSRFALKELVSRDRPYMYFDDPPADKIAEGDGNRSFPSGHAIVAFNGAAFTATVFAMKYPDSPYRWPVTAAAYTLATATAVLRVTGGSHFATDVAAGALIGSLTGFAVPFAYLKFREARGNADTGVNFAPLPSGFIVSIRY
jgi:membrane-associated phospholipid phosphatase